MDWSKYYKKQVRIYVRNEEVPEVHKTASIINILQMIDSSDMMEPVELRSLLDDIRDEAIQNVEVLQL